MTCDLRFEPAAVDVLTASKNDVKTSRNSNRAFCTTIKLLFHFERINKLDRFQSYWQLFPFFYSLKYYVTLLLSHQSKGCAKMTGMLIKS